MVSVITNIYFIDKTRRIIRNVGKTDTNTIWYVISDNSKFDAIFVIHVHTGISVGG